MAVVRHAKNGIFVEPHTCFLCRALVERTVSGTGLTTHREGRLFDGDAVLAEYNPDTGSLTINRSRRAHSEDAGGGR